MDKTIDFYNQNACDFIAGTIAADMSDARNRFLSYVEENGRILDWGCGSGRDALYFQSHGYDVVATDASKVLCQKLLEKADFSVRCECFDELNEQAFFDGIWACASLLHVGMDDLPRLFQKARNALKPAGYLYVSFKYGEFQGERNGRYFTDLTEVSMCSLLNKVKKLEIVEEWTTTDVRPDRNEKWLNVIMKRED